MRKVRSVHSSIFELFAEHEIARELKGMSEWLDAHPQLLEWVAAALREPAVKATGRPGLTAESVLRCALLKQHRPLSYEELAFHLLDSASFQAFARLPRGLWPRKSARHKSISRISAETWERLNRHLLGEACAHKQETGRVVRVDSTVTPTPIHSPSDSTLLWDGIRVMVRLLREGEALAPEQAPWRNVSRAAKKRVRAIEYTRGQEGPVVPATAGADAQDDALAGADERGAGRLELSVRVECALACRSGALPGVDQTGRRAERAADCPW